MMVQSYKHVEDLLNIGKIGNVKRHSIEMLEACKKDYLKLIKKNKTLQGLVEAFLEELKERPYIGQKLCRNFPGCRSIHFGGNSYRIIYKIIEEPVSTILVLEIGHRSSSYTVLARRLEQGK